MLECYSCHKAIAEGIEVCPHCGQRHPTGVPLFKHPVVIVAVVFFSAVSFWLFHTYSKVPDWASGLLSVLIVVSLFWLFWKIGD